MKEETRDDVRNLAIVAHVDHGKTSLADAMLWQSELLEAHDGVAERVMESIDPQREKRLSVMAKVTSMPYRKTRINMVDVPGHASFGSESERALRMVEGVLLLVDASEGPAPQTRFVLRKALEAGLAPIVVLNKIDRANARPAAALAEVRELFVDLDASQAQTRFPVLYTNARLGTCRRVPDGPDESLLPLFEEILRAVPPPRHDADGPLQFQVTSLEYDDFLGRLATGRLFGGALRDGQRVLHCAARGGEATPREIGGIYGYSGPQRIKIDAAGPGDIVSLVGIESVAVGDSVTDPERPHRLPPLPLDEPTLTLLLEVNDSPTAGVDGARAGGPELRERLWREILTNAAIRIEETDSPNAFLLAGRGELQLAILIEMMRREGHEMLVSGSRVLTRDSDGERQEPIELLVVDCPERFIGVVTEKTGARRGRMTKMVNHGSGRVRMEFRIPARGLIGFRAEFLSDTRGTGILHHFFDGYAPWAGEIPRRSTGSLVADRPGRATAYAIEHLQPRGSILVAPGDQVYEGQIVGENSRATDLAVNVTKERKAAGAAPPQTVGLIPPRSMILEQALEFIRDDERVEVTPRSLRLRKKTLEGHRRRDTV